MRARNEWYVPAVAALLGWGVTAGCGDAPPTPVVTATGLEEVRVDLAHSNGLDATIVVISNGAALTLALRDIGDGGYGPWVIGSFPNPAILSPTSASHEAPSSGLDGDFGKDLFGFEAVTAGQTSVRFTATRSWSGDTETFTVTVIVT